MLIPVFTFNVSKPLSPNDVAGSLSLTDNWQSFFLKIKEVKYPAYYLFSMEIVFLTLLGVKR